jgi:oxygen-independent coproporphyrinogen-3 oxidase
VGAGKKPVAGRETLSPSQLALEAVLLRLRTRDGLRLEAFSERYGFDLLARNRRRIEQYIDAGLLKLESGRLFPSLQGMAVADSLARELEIE